MRKVSGFMLKVDGGWFVLREGTPPNKGNQGEPRENEVK